MTESLFGKTYNVVGESSSGLLLKSNGNVKVLWGNKFIDLIKNGKIASDSLLLDIFKIVNNEKDIKENGIYLLNDIIYVCINGTKILLDSSSTNFISFVEEQELLSEEKYTALKNIGFYYDSLEEVKNSKLINGIVFVKETNKLYLISNEVISEYTNVIQSNNLLLGDLYIKGATINSDRSMQLSIGSKPFIDLILDKVNIYKDIILHNNSMLMSNGADNSNGFRFYTENSKYILEIDKIKVRDTIIVDNYISVTVEEFRELILNNKLIPNSKYKLTNFRNYWELLEPEILENYVDDSGNTIYKNTKPIIITSKTNNSYYDICYFEDHLEWQIKYDVYHLKEYTIEETNIKSLGLITYLKDENNNEANYNFKDLKFYRDNIWYHTFSDSSGLESSINYKNNYIYLKNIKVLTLYNNNIITLEGTNSIILTNNSSNNKFYNLESEVFISTEFYNNIIYNNWLNNTVNSSITNCIFFLNVESTLFDGILTNCTFNGIINLTDLFKYNFNNCEFFTGILNQFLELDSSSISVLLNIEPKLIYAYVEESIQKIKIISSSLINIPSGTIVMWYGTEIPYGWAICDGNNGTPNLIGKFIKASTSSGDIASDLNENNELTLTVDNLPKHSHPHLSHTHSITVEDISGTTDSSDSLSSNFDSNDYINSINTETATVINNVSNEGVETTTKDVISSISHTSKGGSTSGGSHSHSFSVSNVTASCNSSTSIELDETEWKNTPIKIEPRAYALIFIMKL